MMDTGEGSNTGNGHSADPTPTPPQSTSPAGGSGESAVPLVVVDTSPARDPKNGRILPGHSGNPKGRKPGIPNRNSELVKLVNTRELAWCWRTAKAQAKKGDNALLQFLLARTLLEQSPTSAGIVINATASAQATVENTTEIHDRLEELRDPAVRDAFCDLVDRLEARNRNAGPTRRDN